MKSDKAKSALWGRTILTVCALILSGAVARIGLKIGYAGTEY
jgi:hypothetical protein